MSFVREIGKVIGLILFGVGLFALVYSIIFYGADLLFDYSAPRIAQVFLILCLVGLAGGILILHNVNRPEASRRPEEQEEI